MLYRRIALPDLDDAPSSGSQTPVTGALPAGSAFLRLSFLPTEGAIAAGPLPEACLSLSAWGDMRYLEGEDNPKRSAFFSHLGLSPSAVLGTELFHTRRILLEGRDGMKLGGPEPAAEAPPAAGDRKEGLVPEGSHDGILLRNPARAACVTVADCMPIWLLDRHSGSFGVLHSGWKGTGILAVALRSLAEEFGSPAEAVSVILGPAIGACCYAVPRERAEAFAGEFGSGAVREEGNRTMLDLRAANVALASSLGVGALLSVEACTSCDPRLGSFRREGGESFTRMAALAAILPGNCPAGCLVTPASTL